MWSVILVGVRSTIQSAAAGSVCRRVSHVGVDIQRSQYSFVEEELQVACSLPDSFILTPLRPALNCQGSGFLASQQCALG